MGSLMEIKNENNLEFEKEILWFVAKLLRKHKSKASIAALCLSLIWFNYNSGFGPIIVFLISISGLIYSYYPKVYNFFAKQIEKELMLYIPGLNNLKSISICIGADTNKWEPNPMDKI